MTKNESRYEHLDLLKGLLMNDLLRYFPDLKQKIIISHRRRNTQLRDYDDIMPAITDCGALDGLQFPSKYQRDLLSLIHNLDFENYDFSDWPFSKLNIVSPYIKSFSMDPDQDIENLEVTDQDIQECKYASFKFELAFLTQKLNWCHGGIDTINEILRHETSENRVLVSKYFKPLEDFFNKMSILKEKEIQAFRNLYPEQEERFSQEASDPTHIELSPDFSNVVKFKEMINDQLVFNFICNYDKLIKISNDGKLVWKTLQGNFYPFLDVLKDNELITHNKKDITPLFFRIVKNKYVQITPGSAAAGRFAEKRKIVKDFETDLLKLLKERNANDLD